MTETKPKTIAEKLGMTEANKDERVLVQWSEDFRRMGSIDGLFVSTRAKLAALDGKAWYLGEVLGKHSEVQGTFDADSFALVDPTLEISFGFDPFRARERCVESEYNNELEEAEAIEDPEKRKAAIRAVHIAYGQDPERA